MSTTDTIFWFKFMGLVEQLIMAKFSEMPQRKL